MSFLFFCILWYILCIDLYILLLIDHSDENRLSAEDIKHMMHEIQQYKAEDLLIENV